MYLTPISIQPMDSDSDSDVLVYTLTFAPHWSYLLLPIRQCVINNSQASYKYPENSINLILSRNILSYTQLSKKFTYQQPKWNSTVKSPRSLWAEWNRRYTKCVIKWHFCTQGSRIFNSVTRDQDNLQNHLSPRVLVCSSMF